MDYRTTRYIDSMEYLPLLLHIKFLGWMASLLVLNHQFLRQDLVKTSTPLSQLTEKNPVSSLSSNYSKAKTLESQEGENADQSGDTELNTKCKFYFYINVVSTDSLIGEPICLITLSYTKVKPQVKPSRVTKNYTGKLYYYIKDIIILIYYQ